LADFAGFPSRTWARGGSGFNYMRTQTDNRGYIHTYYICTQLLAVVAFALIEFTCEACFMRVNRCLQGVTGAMGTMDCRKMSIR